MLVLALSLLVSAQPAPAEAVVIPPGREPLLREMLARPGLPGACAPTALRVERTYVRATYACQGRPGFAIELHAPGAERAAFQTRQFSIRVDPEQAAADPAIAPIIQQITQREDGWRWLRPLECPGWSEAVVDTARFPILPLALAIAALATLAHVWLDRRARGSSDRVQSVAASRPRWAPFAVAAISFVVLQVAIGAPPLHLDTARDLLIARDVAAGRDVLPAVSTSFPGAPLVHGTPWILLLAAFSRIGLSLEAVRVFVQVLAALSVGLVWHATRRVVGPVAATAAAGLHAAAAVWTVEAPFLWNPSLLPLPLAAAMVGLLSIARTGAPWGALVSLASLGVATQVHVMSVLLVPVALAVVATFARRPSWTVCGAAAAFAAAWVGTGRLAAAEQLQAALRYPTLALVPLGAIAAGLALRGRVPSLDARGRAMASALAAAAGATASVAALAIASGHGFEARYAAPATPAVPIALALLCAAVARNDSVLLRRDGAPVAGRTAFAATALGAIVLLATVARGADRLTRDDKMWTFPEAATLAQRLYGTGYSYGDLHRHVRAPDRARALVAALAALDPGSDPGPGEQRLEDDLLVVKMPAAAARDAPPEWTLVPLPGDQVAVVRPLRSALRWDGVDVCADSRSDAGARPECQRVHLAPEPARRFADRAYPRQLSAPAVGQGGAPVALRASVARSPEGAARRVFTAVGECAWRVEAGVGAPGSVELAPGAAAPLVLRFEVSDPGRECLQWIPTIVETEQTEERLRRATARW